MELIRPTLHDVFLTCIRWLGGLAAGSIAGFVVAALEPYRRREAAARDFTLIAAVGDFLRALPIIALVPVIQTVGIGERWKIGLIAWAVLFPIWLSVRQARRTRFVDTELNLSGRVSSYSEVFWSYRFPKALAGFLRGVEISIGVAWLSVVAAEWIGTYSTGFWAGGLGYKVVKAHDANNWGAMLLCLGWFGLLGVASAYVWRTIFSSKRSLGSGFSPMRGYQGVH